MTNIICIFYFHGYDKYQRKSVPFKKQTFNNSATSKRDFNLDNIEQVLCGSNSIGMLRQNDLVQLTDEALVKLRAVKYEKENSQLHNHDNIASILLKVLERKTKDEPALGKQNSLLN